MATAQIHPTAIVQGNVTLGDDVVIGPMALLDGDITLGAGCKVGPRVTMLGHITAGANNTFHNGCVIGDHPQHQAYAGEPTRVEIGTGNVFREFVTIHRGMPSVGGVTKLGDGNFLMANSHVAHDAIVGNKAVFANSAVIGGHATVMDGAFLSGNTCVHQHCRVGQLAMLSGTSSVSMDLPPYWIVQGVNYVFGINVVGMRRAGIPNEEIMAVRSAYKTITRSGQPIRTSLDQIEAEHGTLAAVKVMVEFIRTSKRGICMGLTDA
jgi:UDP-N-acetylglucosamine acyltransferase